LLVLIGRRFTAGELVRSLNAFGIGSAVAIEAGAPLQTRADLVTKMNERKNWPQTC
jgi:hypothetical protein